MHNYMCYYVQLLPWLLATCIASCATTFANLFSTLRSLSPLVKSLQPIWLPSLWTIKNLIICYYVGPKLVLLPVQQHMLVHYYQLLLVMQPVYYHACIATCSTQSTTVLVVGL